MTRARPWLPTLAGAAGLAVVVLTGCGGAAQDGAPTTHPDAAQGSQASAPDGSTATASPAGDDVSATSAPDDAAATTAGQDGAEVTSADGAFTLQPPAGWVDVSGTLEQAVEVALRDDAMSGDFFSNVVVTSEEPLAHLEESVEAAAAELAGEEGRYTMLPVVSIDGEEAPGYVVHRVADEVPIAQVQRWVQHGDRLYVLTLSTAADEEEASRETFDQLVQSWTWTD